MGDSTNMGIEDKEEPFPSSIDFLMISIGLGEMPELDQSINTFQDASDQLIISLINNRDQHGLRAVHWTSRGSQPNESDSLVVALVAPITDCSHIYDILALKVLDDVSTLNQPIGGTLQINFSQHSSEEYQVHQYDVCGLQNVYFLSTSGSNPELCLAAARRLKAESNCGNMHQGAPPSVVTLVNNSEALYEGWTALHMCVLHEDIEATRVISYLISQFDDEQEKVRFLEIVDKENLTRLQLSDLANLSESTTASSTGDGRLKRDQNILNHERKIWTIIHLCAVENSTRVYNELKIRIVKENWCDFSSIRNNRETDMKISVNADLPGTIMVLSSFPSNQLHKLIPETSNIVLLPEFSFPASKLLLPGISPNTLHFAVLAGDFQLAIHLLKHLPQNVDVNNAYISQINSDGENILHLLAQHRSEQVFGASDILQTLSDLESSSEITPRTLRRLLSQLDGSGYAPIHKSVKMNNIQFLLDCLEHLKDMSEVKEILSQKTGDDLTLLDVAHVDTKKNVEVLMDLVDKGVEETLNCFELDLQSNINNLPELTPRVIVTHIMDANVVASRYPQRQYLWCAALAIHLKNEEIADELMSAAMVGSDNVHLYSNMCRLSILKGNHIDALEYAYHMLMKAQNKHMRLAARAEKGVMLTIMPNAGCDFVRAKEIQEDVLRDRDFPLLHPFSKLKIMVSYVHILTLMNKRMDGTQAELWEQKRMNSKRAEEILNKMLNILEFHEDIFCKTFCLIWSAEIASLLRKWSPQTFLDLNYANSLLDHLVRDYWLYARIAKVAVNVCYSAIQYYSWDELDKFYQLGLENCNQSLDLSHTQVNGFSKVQLLLFPDLKDLYHQKEAWLDFRRCVLHKRKRDGPSHPTVEERLFLDHLKFHYFKPDKEPNPRIAEAHDLALRVHKGFTYRTFVVNLRVLLKLKFRMGKSAKNIGNFVTGYSLDSQGMAQVCLDIGQFYQYEKNLTQARKLYQKSKELNENNWEADQLLRCIDRYATIEPLNHNPDKP